MHVRASTAVASEARTFTIAELDNDPHGIFRRERARAPFLVREDGVIYILRARDIQNLITDRFTRQIETEAVALRGVESGPVFDLVNSGMLTSNGAAHRRRRGPMSRAFAFRVVRDLRPRIRQVAEGLLDRHHACREMNLLDDYAATIPALVIGDILGLPPDEAPTFMRFVYAAATIFTTSWTRDDVPALQEAAGQLLDYCTALIAKRRREPKDDFVTSYIQAADEAGELSPAEILVQLALVILAGSDTTRAALVIQVALLLARPDHWAALCSNLDLVPAAVREALRLEPAVGSIPRVTLEDLELDGYTLPKDRYLALSTMSGMRDPELYRDPDRFDIDRTDHPRWHMVFGGGAHRCLGEALAIAELEEGLTTLASRVPDLRIVGNGLRVGGHGGIRRVSAVIVERKK